jgi:hypothetical protein
MFRKLPVLSILILALALFAIAPVQASEPVEIERFPFEEEIWNPCAEEWVELEGTLQFVSHWAEDENGGVHLLFQVVPQNIRGVGHSTGAEYRFSGSVIEVDNFTWYGVDRAETFTFIDQHRFIAQGASENGVLMETVHITMDANGEHTIRYEFRMQCQ